MSKKSVAFGCFRKRQKSKFTDQSLTRSLLSENSTPYRSPVFTTQTGNLGVLSMLPTWSVVNIESNVSSCMHQRSVPVVILKIHRLYCHSAIAKRFPSSYAVCMCLFRIVFTYFVTVVNTRRWGLISPNHPPV